MASRHFSFEHKNKPLLSREAFLRRQFVFVLFALLLLSLSLGLGMIGYRLATGMSWIDAFYNASMILTGMGPVDAMHSTGAKIFAGTYALFSGIIFLSTVAVMLSPIVHRFLHIMHLDEDQ